MEKDLIFTENLSVDDEAKEYLTEIAKWATFLSIIGAIGTGLLFIVSIGIIAFGGFLDNLKLGIPTNILGGMYLLISGIYFFPIYYLYKAASNIKEGIYKNNQYLLTEGFKNLKSHYKFIGIFALVMISLYAFIIVISVGGMLLK
jgi:hypothetical protein